MDLAALAPSSLAFRPLELPDLPLLHRWYAAPHAAPWFADRARQIDDEYGQAIRGEVPIFAYVIQYDGSDIGLINWERFGDFPEMMAGYEVTDPDCVNIDVLIGEPEYVQRGLGAPLVQRFLREVVFRDARYKSCVIDPHEANVAAIRAYTKAGFRYVRTVLDPEDATRLHLMQWP
jgi:aminoglycoside 6'-N-acetyltransferase